MSDNSHVPDQAPTAADDPDDHLQGDEGVSDLLAAEDGSEPEWDASTADDPTSPVVPSQPRQDDGVDGDVVEDFPAASLMPEAEADEYAETAMPHPTDEEEDEDDETGFDDDVENPGDTEILTDGAFDYGLLSVIIPAHNVHQYVDQCLQSVLSQRVNLEVIFVDDGSTDGTVERVEQLAERDSRITIIRQNNAGPGPARNAGLRVARGEFLAFVDADDYILPDSYPKMLRSIESNAADFVSANVLRLVRGRTRQSGLHRLLSHGDIQKTHITRFPGFVWDTVAWNKLYRRAFFDRVVGGFEDMLYEDMLPMAQVHVQANHINVISDPVYVWRARDDGSSITQNKSMVSALHDRIRATTEIHALLNEIGDPEVIAAFERKTLINDLMMYMEPVSAGDPDFMEAYLEAVPPLIKSFAQSALEDLPLPIRLAYELILRSRVRDLTSILPYIAEAPATFDLQLINGRHFANLPFLEGWNALPRDLYDYTDRFQLYADVDTMVPNENGFELRGVALIDGLLARDHQDYFLQCELVSSKTGHRRPVRVETRPATRPTLPVSIGSVTDYRWSGFSIYLDLAHLAAEAPSGATRWQLFLSCESRGITRVCQPRATRGTVGRGKQFGRYHMLPRIGRNQGVEIAQERIRGLLTAHSQNSDGSVDLVVQSPTGLRLKSVDIKSRRKKAPLTSVPLNVAGRQAFKARLSAETLLKVIEATGSGFADIYVRYGRVGRSRLRTSKGVEGATYKVGGAMADLRFTPMGNLVLQGIKQAFILTHVKFADGRFVVDGEASAEGAGTVRLFLEEEDSGERFPLAVSAAGNVHSASLDLLHVARWPGLFGRLPVGVYRLRCEQGDERIEILAKRAAVADLKKVHVLNGLQFDISLVAGSTVKIEIGNRLTDAERGPENQARMQQQVYAANLRLPVRPLALFDSWNGKRIDDNPLAIYRELARLAPHLDLRFCISNASVYVPNGIRTVSKWSREYWDMLAKASLVIVNDRFPTQLQKRPGQLCVQTWHGTPLKRIGFDIANPVFDPNYQDALAGEVPKWDLLLSQSLPATQRLRSAFQYDGEVAEVGYPRNDALKAPDAAVKRKAMRDRLNFNDEDFVILYAPTWRDDQRITPGKYGFSHIPDLGQIRERVPSAKLIFRGHHLLAPSTATGVGFAVNMSTYPDINDLYLAADVLVSDYSSSIVDFSITRKPMVLYVPDLFEFGSRLRGFYGDFMDEVPAAIATDQEELLKALQDVQSGHPDPRIRRRYSRWSAKYTALDDGAAATRISNRLISFL